MSKVSVVIPCYNQGEFIDEAIASVQHQTYPDYEIIVVNDGSTDEKTLLRLESYNASNIKVIHTDNRGLPSARNTGIKHCAGKYILPLDADDKIATTYLEEASSILDTIPEVGIVYSNADLFGEKQGKFPIETFTIENMLILNVIFSCAMFRKDDWQQVGGYNPNMVYGLEDWDFWLSLIELGRRPYKIDHTLFYYRIREGTMLGGLANDRIKRLQMLNQIYSNHKSLYESNLHLIMDKCLHNFLHSRRLELESQYLITKIQYIIMKSEELINRLDHMHQIYRLTRESYRYKIGSHLVNVLKAPYIFFTHLKTFLMK